MRQQNPIVFTAVDVSTLMCILTPRARARLLYKYLYYIKIIEKSVYIVSCIPTLYNTDKSSTRMCKEVDGAPLKEQYRENCCSNANVTPTLR